MPRSMLREKQDEAVKDFIEREVLPCLEEHKSYANKVDNWTKRFEAVRSIQGLSYGDDPDKFPKLEPWEYSADVGIPLEAITLRAIIARFVKTIFTKPICNITPRGPSDKTSARILQEYNEYALEDEMNFERQFYDIMMDVGLAGDGYGKLIEANEEYEWDETYFTLIHPDTGDPIPDPSTINEFDPFYPNGYPIEVPEDFQPPPDVSTGVIPEVKQITVTKTDKVYFGTKLIPIDPKDLVLPDWADTHDLDELPFVGHLIKKNWHWLNERVGDVEEGGYDESAVYQIKPDEEKGKVSTVPKIQLIEVWGKVDLPLNTSDEDPRNKVREIIALYAIEKGELLGWIPNPYKGRRMIFHWQIMPMPHRTRGKSIPEFCRGIRDLVDSMVNNLINRDTINAHAPFVYDEESGFDPEIHTFGPHEFWGVNDKARLGRLEMGNYSEHRTEWVIQFTMGIIQRLFGVNDYVTGNDSNSQNKTARGIMAIIGEGNFSFDTMIALLQMTNKKFFEANIRMHAKMLKEHNMQDKVFYVTESKDDPYRKISLKLMDLAWNFKPRGTSVDNNAHKRKVYSTEAYNLLGKNLFFSPQLTPTTASNLRELTQDVVDAYEVGGVVLPTNEQLEKEMIEFQAKVMMEVQKKQQLEKLKTLAKVKRGTPEGVAASRVLADIQLGESNSNGSGDALTGT